MHDLWQQGYRAVFIATGARRGEKLGIPKTPDLSFLDGEKVRRVENRRIWVDPRTMMTNVEGIFAGGDVVSGPATVIEAIAAGRKAAFSIDKYLRGEKLEDEASVARVIGIEAVDTDRFPKRERQKIELGFTEMEALCEADRCFQCGLFPKKPPHPIPLPGGERGG